MTVIRRLILDIETFLFCYLCKLDRLQYILVCKDKQRILWCCYNTHDLHHSYALLLHTRLCLQKTI